MNPSLRATYPALTDEDIDMLERGLQVREVAAGEVLIAEGSVSNVLYLIQRGSATVRKEHLGMEVDIADLAEGELFGEMSLLLQEPATASVVMATDGTIASMSGNEIRALAASRPGMDTRLYHSLARVLARRLAKMSRVTIPSFVGG